MSTTTPPANDTCIFCKIVAGTLPCHQIWEDENHLAFLSIFPNTPGFSVVITKTHYPSYVFEVADEVLTNLIQAAKQVARLIDTNLEDVGRTGLIAEGYGVDHLHVKLFPMHGTADMTKWQPIEKHSRQFYTTYPGFISSGDYERADDAELAAIAKKIRGSGD